MSVILNKNKKIFIRCGYHLFSIDSFERISFYENSGYLYMYMDQKKYDISYVDKHVQNDGLQQYYYTNEKDITVYYNGTVKNFKKGTNVDDIKNYILGLCTLL